MIASAMFSVTWLLRSARRCALSKWSKIVMTTILDHCDLFRTEFKHSQDQSGPKWSFCLISSILVNLGPPTVLWPFLSFCGVLGLWDSIGVCDIRHAMPFRWPCFVILKLFSHPLLSIHRSKLITMREPIQW